MADQTLTVAVAQTSPSFGDVTANVRSGSSLLAQAAQTGAQLLVFPELSLIGYDLGCLTDPGTWVTAADPRLDPLRRASQETGITSVAGAALRHDDGTRWIASLVFQPDGGLAVHGKQNLHGAERELFQPAGPSQLLTIAGWKIALAICYDAGVPSHAEAVAALGAEVYAASVLYTDAEARRFDLHLAARAMDHRMYAVAANFAGHGPGWQSCGGSGVWHPDGRRLHQAGTEAALLSMTLSRKDLEALRDKDASAGYPRGAAALTASGTAG